MSGRTSLILCFVEFAVAIVAILVCVWARKRSRQARESRQTPAPSGVPRLYIVQTAAPRN